MIVAIPVSRGKVGGPGESEEVLIVDSEKNFAVVEQYPNPAITAQSARGIRMIESALERNATALIVGHIGMHAYGFAREKMLLYSAEDMGVSEAISLFRNKELPEFAEENARESHHSH